jgi:hypothetical protein
MGFMEEFLVQHPESLLQTFNTQNPLFKFKIGHEKKIFTYLGPYMNRGV